MEFLRRPSVLAAAAAALLALNVVVLVAEGNEPGVAVDDPRAEPTSAADGDDPAASGEDDGADAAGDGQAGGGDTADAAAGGGGDTDDGPAAGGDAGQGDGQEGTGDGEAAEEDTDEQATGLGVPVSGTYSYASGGTWSLRGGDAPEEHQLPATATGTVEVSGDAWQLRLVAGDRYADRFGFVLGPDGGLDWTEWVLEREFDSGPSETPYECSGDSAHYRPDEQGRVATHVCQGPGITSEGRIEHLGREDVTLGDGTVVQADRLLYDYTVAGDGVSGEGRLDLWLDPATGLRVREQRSIRTTSTTAQGTQLEYREDVDLTLTSRDPA